jgi:hypothetical protein
MRYAQKAVALLAAVVFAGLLGLMVASACSSSGTSTGSVSAPLVMFPADAATDKFALCDCECLGSAVVKWGDASGANAGYKPSETIWDYPTPKDTIWISYAPGVVGDPSFSNAATVHKTTAAKCADNTTPAMTYVCPGKAITLPTAKNIGYYFEVDGNSVGPKGECCSNGDCTKEGETCQYASSTATYGTCAPCVTQGALCQSSAECCKGYTCNIGVCS